MTATNDGPATQDNEPSGIDTVPSYREKLVQFHRALVEAESVTGRETTAGNVLVQYLEQHGFVCSRQALPACSNTEAGCERQNVLAWPSGSLKDADNIQAGPRLLVSAHIDTVPPFIPYGIDPGPITKSTVIRGRGSVDAKASVVAQVLAVEALLAEERIRRQDVMLLYVVGEEEGGDGMRAFSQAVHRDSAAAPAPVASGLTCPLAGPLPRQGFQAAIFGEPTDNKLARGHKGLLIGTITARGTAGHSGYPWLGASANELLMRALVRAMDADLGSSAAFDRTTMNVGLLQGGVAGNVIAETASAEVVIRVAVGPQASGHEVVKARLMEILGGVDAEAFSAEWRGGYGAVPCHHDVEGFAKIMVNFGTDAPVLEGDYRRYLYGPGTILVAHSDHEALTLGEMEQAVEDYKTLILDALNMPPKK